MKFEINPDFEHLRGFIEELPAKFDKEGKVIYSGRNLIKVMTVKGLEINVKRYGVPALINRIVYSFFRAPKGRRAFTHPQILLSKGFETPVPIAYIEERKWGLISSSYFVSAQSQYRRNFYEFGDADIAGCKDIVTAFARYTAALHEADVLHLDYSPGNILFDEIGGQYHFSLVDTNRMYFGKVSIKKGCSNFARLWGQKPFFELLAKEYAAARNADKNLCTKWVFAYRKKFWTYFSRKHKVKYKLEL